MGVVIEVGSVQNFARLAALRTGLGERVKKVVTRVLVRRLEVENRKIENRESVVSVGGPNGPPYTWDAWALV